MFTFADPSQPIYSVVVSTEDRSGRWSTGETSRGYLTLSDAQQGASDALARPFRKGSRKGGYYRPAQIAREVWITIRVNGSSSKVEGTFAERLA